MAATYTLTQRFSGYTHTLTVDVVSQDRVANTTTVDYSYVLHRNVSSSLGTNETGHAVTFHAILDGVDNSDNPNFNFHNAADIEVLSGEQTINNALDGTLSFTVQLSTPGKTGSAYLTAASLSGTFIVDQVDRSSSFTVSPQPALGGQTFTVDISRLDSGFTHDVYMTDSSGTVTTVATGVATSTTGTTPSLSGASDTASIQVDTVYASTVIGSQIRDLLIWDGTEAPPINLETPFDLRFRRLSVVSSKLTVNEVIPYTAASITDTFSDTGTCSITTETAIYSTNLDKAVVYAEVFNGAAWVNTGLVFTLTRTEDDASNLAGVITYSGTSYVDFILGKGILTGDYTQHSVTPGKYLRKLLVAGQSRHWGPMVSWAFTDTKTSVASNWATTKITQTVNAGTPFLQVLQGFVKDVLVEYRTDFNETTGRAGLVMYNPGYGYDWTTKDSKTVVNLKTEGVTRVITNNPTQRDYSGMLTAVTATGNTTSRKVRNAAGKLVTQSSTLTRTKTRDDLVDPIYGKLEARVDASGVGSAAVLTAVADSVITLANTPVTSRQFTYEVGSQDITPALYPYRVFRPGDWVLVPGNDGTAVRERIAQLVISKSSESTTVQVTTGDLIPSGPAAMYKYVRRSAAGAIPGGVQTATPVVPATVLPLAVASVTATQAATFDSTGLARTSVTVSWDPVIVDAQGNDVTVTGYQILTRASYTDPWTLVSTV